MGSMTQQPQQPDPPGDGSAGSTGAAGAGTPAAATAYPEKYSMRLQMPGDDEVVRAFAEAQGPRALSPAIRHLIHMWVNEFGAVSVMDLVLSGVSMSRMRTDAGAVAGAAAPAGPAGLSPQAAWPRQPVQHPAQPDQQAGQQAPAPVAEQPAPAPEPVAHPEQPEPAAPAPAPVTAQQQQQAPAGSGLPDYMFAEPGADTEDQPDQQSQPGQSDQQSQTQAETEQPPAQPSVADKANSVFRR